jgi:acyl-CoA thioester hydrolase
MTRIDRARLERARFSCVYEGQTRFDDLDVQGHVNNAAAVVLLQEARVRLNGEVGLRDGLDGLRVLVVALAVEYAGEMRHPAIVEIGTGVLAIGRSSITLGQLARQEGRATLYAEAVIVVADGEGPTAIPDGLREAYARHMIAE